MVTKQLDEVHLETNAENLVVKYGIEYGRFYYCRVIDNNNHGSIDVWAVGEFSKFLYAIALRFRDGDKDYAGDMLHVFNNVKHYCWNLRADLSENTTLSVVDYVSYFIVNNRHEPFFDDVIMPSLDYLPEVDDETKKQLKRLSTFVSFWTWCFHCQVLHHEPINDDDKHGYFLFIDRCTTATSRHYLSSSFDIVSEVESIHLQDPAWNYEFFNQFDGLNGLSLKEIELATQAHAFNYLEDAANFIHTAYYGLWDDVSSDAAGRDNPAYPLHYFMQCCKNQINMGVHDDEIGYYRDMMRRYYRRNASKYRQCNYDNDNIPVLDMAFINQP